MFYFDYRAAEDLMMFDDVDSPIEALAGALGKYFLYRAALADARIKTPLYMAVTQSAYQGILSEKIGILAVSLANISFVVFDPDQEEIIQWIP
jgi:XisH protein